MGLFLKKKQKVSTLSRSEALSYVPVKNNEVHIESETEEKLILSYPLQLKPLLADVAKRFGMWKDNNAPLKQLELDSLGKFVWNQINGKLNVREISSNFAKKYDVLPREAEIATTSFLKNLGKRGLIAFTEKTVVETKNKTKSK